MPNREVTVPRVGRICTCAGHHESWHVSDSDRHFCVLFLFFFSCHVRHMSLLWTFPGYKSVQRVIFIPTQHIERITYSRNQVWSIRLGYYTSLEEPTYPLFPFLGDWVLLPFILSISIRACFAEGEHFGCGVEEYKRTSVSTWR